MCGVWMLLHPGRNSQYKVAVKWWHSVTTLCPDPAPGLSGSPLCLTTALQKVKSLLELQDPNVIQALFDTAVVDWGTQYFSIPVQLDSRYEILT